MSVVTFSKEMFSLTVHNGIAVVTVQYFRAITFLSEYSQEYDKISWLVHNFLLSLASDVTSAILLQISWLICEKFQYIQSRLKT